MSVHVKSATVNVDGDWQQDKGLVYHARVGGDPSAIPEVEALKEVVDVSLAQDPQGQVSFVENSTITLPLDEPVQLDSHGTVNYDGNQLDVQGKNTVDLPVDEVDGKIGVQGGLTTSDQGTRVHAGPTGSVDFSVEDADDQAQGQVDSTLDLSFSTMGGQTSGGVTLTNTGQVDLNGDPVLQVNANEGVDVTTGPGGTRVGFDQSASGTLGNDQLGTVSGGSTSRSEFGVDADGNRIDRTTTTTQSQVTTSDGQVIPLDSGTTTTEDDSSGLWGVIDDIDQAVDDLDLDEVDLGDIDATEVMTMPNPLATADDPSYADDSDYEATYLPSEDDDTATYADTIDEQDAYDPAPTPEPGYVDQALDYVDSAVDSVADTLSDAYSDAVDYVSEALGGDADEVPAEDAW
jgi:hypothetical protein